MRDPRKLLTYPPRQDQTESEIYFGSLILVAGVTISKVKGKFLSFYRITYLEPASRIGQLNPPDNHKSPEARKSLEFKTNYSSRS